MEQALGITILLLAGCVFKCVNLWCDNRDQQEHIGWLETELHRVQTKCDEVFRELVAPETVERSL